MNGRFLILISAVDRTAINTVAKSQLDTKGGERTFSVGLSATGQAPVTHFWCSSVVAEQKVQTVSDFAVQFPNAKVFPYEAEKDPKFPGRLLATLGLKQLSKFPEKPWR